MRSVFTVLLSGLASSFLMAQPNREIDLEDFAEQRFQVQDHELDYETLYESLLLYHTNPLNLNKATREEIASLYILSPGELNNLLDYREQHGPFISLYELQAVPDLPRERIRELLPFVTVTSINDPRPLLKRITSTENAYLLLRYSRTLEKREGYRRENKSGYAGDPNKLYGRLRISQPNDFSLGLTFEKDDGEQLTWNKKNRQYGFDYYSAHFFIENQGKLDALVIGDYQLQFGQGLVLGSGFTPGKGAETTNTVKRNTIGIRPYTSVLESGFFRGAAATMAFGRIKATSFFSALKQDANLVNDTTYSDFEEFINSIQATGYHRTSRELSAKNQIRELSGGFGLQFDVNHRLSIGGTGLYSYYSRPLQKKPNNYNQFEFSGNQNGLTSLFANYNWQNMIFFGEAAISKSGGFGGVGGLIASLTPKLDFSWVIRHYDKDYHSFYGNAFSENSRVINEKGLYWGIKFSPSRKYKVSAYFDRFIFPWLKYRVEAPSDGYEYLGRFTYKPSRSISMYAQYRVEHKERTEAVGTENINELIPTRKANYLFNIDYKIGRRFRMKTRVQGSSYKETSKRTTGIAIIQDLNVKFKQLKLSTRFAVFETSNFENRQYVYERDVLYAFSIPAYQETGARSYLLAQYNVTRNLRLYARYARFKYADQETISSGLNEIEGDQQSEIKLMVRLKLQ